MTEVEFAFLPEWGTNVLLDVSSKGAHERCQEVAPSRRLPRVYIMPTMSGVAVGVLAQPNQDWPKFLGRLLKRLEQLLLLAHPWNDGQERI